MDIEYADFWSARGKYGCFSNFSKHSVIYCGIKAPTSEHLYQALKMANGEDFQKVIKAPTPKEAKVLAHSLPYVSNWDNIKYRVMKDVIRLKVKQHEDIRKILLETGEKQIREVSPKDYIWGIGHDGSGQNLLGKVWMEIRSELLA